MGRAIDTISGFVTAPSSTLTAWTMATGDSLTLRNANQGKRISLLSFWVKNKVAGIFRVHSPKLHDNTQGIRVRVPVGLAAPRMVPGFQQPLYAQDTLVVEQSGSAVGGAIETGSLLVYYEDLPGADGRFIMADEVNKRGVNIVANEIALTSGAGGGYTGSAALNATFDLLKANTDYAVLGIQSDKLGATVTIKGPDTANLRVGCPAELTLPHVCNDFFRRLNIETGLPCIPVINSANKAGTTVEVVTDDGAGTYNVNVILVELAK